MILLGFSWCLVYFVIFNISLLMTQRYGGVMPFSKQLELNNINEVIFFMFYSIFCVSLGMFYSIFFLLQ
jgi:hypothetical protein